MCSEDELCIQYPNHVFGWQTRSAEVFGKRIKHSNLSVQLPRLYVRPFGPPTPSEDIVFGLALYTSPPQAKGF